MIALAHGIPISSPAGATIESGIGTWPDLPEGQDLAVPALWEANRDARHCALALFTCGQDDHEGISITSSAQFDEERVPS